MSGSGCCRGSNNILSRPRRDWPRCRSGRRGSVLAVPQGKGKAQSLLLIADAGEAVLAPVIGARAGLVVREIVPRIADLAVVPRTVPHWRSLRYAPHCRHGTALARASSRRIASGMLAGSEVGFSGMGYLPLQQLHKLRPSAPLRQVPLGEAHQCRQIVGGSSAMSMVRQRSDLDALDQTLSG
jgi:hypothetical protein